MKPRLEHFLNQQKHPVAIGEDNRICIKLRQNSVMLKGIKRMKTKYYFIKDNTEDGTISIHYGQNGSRHLHNILTRIEGGNIQNFDGKKSTQSAQF